MTEPCAICETGAHELCLRAVDAYEYGHDNPETCGCLVCYPRRF